MPTWAERRLPSGFLPVEIVAFAVIAFCLFNTAMWAIIIFYYRNHPFLRAGSPLFLAAMLFGAMLIFVGLAQSAPSYVSSTGCVVRVWFVAAGTTFLHGSLIAKTCTPVPHTPA